MTERERELRKNGAYTVRGVVGVLVIVALGVTLSQSRAVVSEASPTSGRLDSTAFLTGQSLRSISSDFDGGEVAAFMGGLELDLRGATMADDEAVLEVTVVMGGVAIRIPENWTVIPEFDVLLGGVDDKTRSRAEDVTKRLVLTGTVMMGGLDIRN